MMGNLCYVEARITPQQFSSPELDTDAVVKTILEAMKVGNQRCNMESRLILTMPRDHPEWANEVVQLAETYQPHGVCGIDLAGRYAHIAVALVVVVATAAAVVPLEILFCAHISSR